MRFFILGDTDSYPEKEVALAELKFVQTIFLHDGNTQHICRCENPASAGRSLIRDWGAFEGNLDIEGLRVFEDCGRFLKDCSRVVRRECGESEPILGVLEDGFDPRRGLGYRRSCGAFTGFCQAFVRPRIYCPRFAGIIPSRSTITPSNSESRTRKDSNFSSKAATVGRDLRTGWRGTLSA
jgi:hypothetical protein